MDMTLIIQSAEINVIIEKAEHERQWNNIVGTCDRQPSSTRRPRTTTTTSFVCTNFFLFHCFGTTWRHVICYGYTHFTGITPLRLLRKERVPLIGGEVGPAELTYDVSVLA